MNNYNHRVWQLFVCSAAGSKFLIGQYDPRTHTCIRQIYEQDLFHQQPLVTQYIPHIANRGWVSVWNHSIPCLSLSSSSTQGCSFAELTEMCLFYLLCWEMKDECVFITLFLAPAYNVKVVLISGLHENLPWFRSGSLVYVSEWICLYNIPLLNSWHGLHTCMCAALRLEFYFSWRQSLWLNDVRMQPSEKTSEFTTLVFLVSLSLLTSNVQIICQGGKKSFNQEKNNSYNCLPAHPEFRTFPSSCGVFWGGKTLKTLFHWTLQNTTALLLT